MILDEFFKFFCIEINCLDFINFSFFLANILSVKVGASAVALGFTTHEIRGAGIPDPETWSATGPQ